MTSDLAPRHALVFGARGLIGSAVCQRLQDDGFSVIRASTQGGKAGYVCINGNQEHDASEVRGLPVFDAVVWAQGLNINDDVASVELRTFKDVIDANLIYVISTLQTLLLEEKISQNARLVVVSSIWETIARPNKFSYTISKAAVGGLVRAAAADLADRNISINGVLPGVIESPMTLSVLSAQQLETIKSNTLHKRLCGPRDVAHVISFLCSEDASGMTGQSLVVDLGFISTRKI